MSKGERVGNFGQNKDLIKSDLEMDLAINPDYINDELMDQPLLYKKWSDMAAKANKNVKIISNKFERVKARVRLEIASESSKLKVAELDAMVLLEPEVEKIESELIKAEQLAESLKGVVQSFRQRHEVLREISTNIRKEIED